MSWLYSIIFAGLMFSSPEPPPAPVASSTENSVPALVIVEDVTERFEQTYPISPNGTVSVANINGPIVIEGSDTNEIRLEAIKVADSKQTLDEIEIDVDSRSDSFKVEAKFKNWRFNSSDDRQHRRRIEVRFRLVVPRTVELKEIESVNGSVNISDISRSTRVSVVNGNLTFRGLTGPAKLSTVNGIVNADLNTLSRDANISLNTVNGRVNLKLPADANATIRAETLNGEIINDLGLAVKRGQYIGRNLHGRLGTGEAQITLESVNGALSIVRARNGRSPAPVQDLTPAASGDNNNDQQAAILRMQTSRQASAIAARARQDQQRALRQAEVELSRVRGQENIAAIVDSEALIRSIEKGVAAAALTLDRFALAGFNSELPSIKKTIKSHAVSEIPTVTVKGTDCVVAVRSWDRQEVSYQLTEVSTQESARSVITEKLTGSNIDLNISGELAGVSRSRVNDNGLPRLEIFVPRKAHLTIVSDSDVEITGVAGDISVTANDSITTIRDVAGKIKLEISDGSARLVGITGALDLNAKDSESYVEGDFESLKADVRDGNLILTLPSKLNARLVSNRPLSFQRPDARPDGATAFRFGTGGPEYRFTLNDGNVTVRDLGRIDGTQ